jgi:hypothetical protein
VEFGQLERSGKHLFEVKLPEMKFVAEVKPGARENSVKEKDGVFRISVKASAIEGRANEAAGKLIAEHFGISAERVRLVSGRRSRKKMFEIN